ncbi:MAG: hypothetical protein Q4D03_06935 [Bacteroidales bacterium]|nr:hypothetical protein [Bacteroidales bacterium]
MKKLLLLVMGLLLSFGAMAQYDIDKIDVQYLYSKLYKNYLKHPNDVAAMYELSQFYITPGNPMGSLPLAMDYIVQAEERYVMMVEDEAYYRDVAKLIKKKITVASVRQAKQHIVDSTVTYLQSVPEGTALSSAELDNIAQSFAGQDRVMFLIEHHRLQGSLIEARRVGTLDALYAFVKKYPNTDEAEAAQREMLEMARAQCAQVQWESEVDAIVAPYLDVEGMSRVAYKRKSTLAYAQACQHHTVEAYQDYLKRYPSGDEYADALDKLDGLLQLEYNNLSTPQEYAAFAHHHAESELAAQAVNHLRNRIVTQRDVEAVRIYLKEFPLDEKRDSIYRLYYGWHLEEGNADPILRFKEENPDFPYQTPLERDLSLARRKDSINLLPRFEESQFPTYTQYIYRLTGRKVSYVGLVRTLQQLIAANNWNGVLERMNKFDISFENDCVEECAELRSIVSAPVDKKKNLVVEVAPSYTMTRPQVVQNGKMLFYNKVEHGKSIITRAQRTVGKKYRWQNIGDVQFTNANNNGSLEFYSLFDHGSKMLLRQGEEICIAANEGTQWTITDIPGYPVNTDYHEYDVVMVPDGSGILLSSDRPNGQNLQRSGAYFHGDTALASDIYYIPRSEHGWGEAINLGINVNTPYCDHSPILSADMKTLYFITDGHGGLGYGDIYVVTRNDIDDWQSWSKPKNYGKETNSGFDEMSVTLSDDEKNLFFISNRTGANACYSIAATHQGGSGSVDVTITPQSTEMKIILIDLSSQNVVHEQKTFTKKAHKTPLYSEKQYVILGHAANGQYVPSILVTPSKKSSIEVSSLALTDLQNAERAIPLYGVVFSSNSPQLRSSAEQELRILADYLQANPKLQIEIQINVPGDDDVHCFNLGKSRGTSVKDFLVTSGIDLNRIVISNFGNVNYMADPPAAEVLMKVR